MLTNDGQPRIFNTFYFTPCAPQKSLTYNFNPPPFANMELWLLIESSSGDSGPCLELRGRRWALDGPFPATTERPPPPFVCVSYAWGSGRCPHPFFPEHHISDRTLSALEAAIRCKDGDVGAFWIDALCVPYIEPARGATLESMGYIYSAASKVVAVLHPDRHQAVSQMTKTDWIDADLLLPFENEAWIASVWTYQEIVNSQSHIVTSAHPESPSISGDEFLNRIGYSLHKYKEATGLTSYEISRQLPNLDGFENIGGDFMIWSAFQRPALQVMSMLDRRAATDVKNRYYAMIGALTPAIAFQVSGASGESTRDLRRRIMAICEAKQDYSFIYSSARRDVSDPARPWAPDPEDDIASILPWFIHGSGQGGYVGEDGRLRLQHVLVLEDVFHGQRQQPSDLEILRQAISKLPLGKATLGDLSIDGLRGLATSVLTTIGFTGNGTAIDLECGILFPQTALRVADGNITILVSAELRWMFGRPAMVIAEGARGRRYVPAVLVGDIDKTLNQRAAMEYVL
jgi:hypothetical protein